jgi:hypothetical protein
MMLDPNTINDSMLKPHERDPGTRETVPFHIWKHNVLLAASRRGVPQEYIERPEVRARIQRAWAAGEPIWMAVDALTVFAKGAAIHERAERDGSPLRSAFLARLRST